MASAGELQNLPEASSCSPIGWPKKCLAVIGRHKSGTKEVSDWMGCDWPKESGDLKASYAAASQCCANVQGWRKYFKGETSQDRKTLPMAGSKGVKLLIFMFYIIIRAVTLSF